MELTSKSLNICTRCSCLSFAVRILFCLNQNTRINHSFNQACFFGFNYLARSAFSIWVVFSNTTSVRICKTLTQLNIEQRTTEFTSCIFPTLASRLVVVAMRDALGAKPACCSVILRSSSGAGDSGENRTTSDCLKIIRSTNIYHDCGTQSTRILLWREETSSIRQDCLQGAVS